METFAKKKKRKEKKKVVIYLRKLSFFSPFYVQIYYGELLKFDGKRKSYYAV